MSEAEKKKIQDEAIIHWEKDVNGNSGQSFITGAEFGYQLAQEEFKQSKQRQREILTDLINEQPNQDELWEDVIELYAENSEKAKKRYRIIRVKWITTI